MDLNMTITQDSGEVSHFTLVPLDGTDGRLDSDYVYAEGRSCTVYRVKDAVGDLHLLKKFKDGYQDQDVGKFIKEVHDRLERVYYPDEEYAGTDENGNRCQVFKLTNSPSLGKLIPLSNINIADRSALRKKLFTLLTTFRGLLSHVDLIHREAGYLHCDITLSNVLIFQPNDQPQIQLIDWDSAVKAEELCSWTPDEIRKAMNDRSSPQMLVYGKTYDVYAQNDIDKYARLDFKASPSRAYVLDTTALAKILHFLLFGTTEFTPSAPNKRAQSYQRVFPSSYTLLNTFFATAFSEDLEYRFDSCENMMEHVDRIINGFPRFFSYANAHAELLTQLSGSSVVEARLQEINEGILPHIQFGDKVYCQQEARSPVAQLMSLPHGKALFLYGEGGAGKSTTAKHFYYSTLLDSPEDRLVLYYSLTQEGLKDIERYLEHPLFGELSLNRNQAKPIVLLDALDESALATSNDSKVYDAFYELVQTYGDRYQLVVTSRSIPKEPEKKNDTPPSSEKTVSFSDVFHQGRFLPLDDDQLKNFLQTEGLRLEEIERQNGEELVETLRLPMMLKLFVKILGNASKEEKEAAFKFRNEVDILHAFMRKLFRDDEDSEYRKAQHGELYDNGGYTLETFEAECLAIAHAAFFCEPPKLKDEHRTWRIFNSMITPVDEDAENQQCKEFAEKLYKEKFESYTQAAQKKYLEDIQGAKFTFGERAQQIIFEKVLTYLSNHISKTSAAVPTKESEDKITEKGKGISTTVKSFVLIDVRKHYDEIQSNRIKSFLRTSIESFDMPIRDSENVFDPFEFSHKCFRDYFRSLEMARQFETLFRDLKWDHRIDTSRIREDCASGHKGDFFNNFNEMYIFPYAYFDSEDYRKIANFFQTVTPHLSASPNEWKFTGLRLGLSHKNDEFAQERAKQFEYLYKCYFGHFHPHAERFAVMNDLYHMICMTYKYFSTDPFEPSVKTSKAGFWRTFNVPFGSEKGEAEEETCFFEKPFTVAEAHGSRYASIYSVPDGVKSIESFDYCPDINTIILGKDVIQIAPHAFDGCPQLKKIDVSQNKNFIDKNGVIFQMNSGAPVWPGILPEEITFPGDIPDINFAWEYKVNSSWPNLFVVNLFSNFRWEYTSGSSNDNIQKMVFSEGVQKIQNNIFGACPNLIHIVLPKTLESLPESLYFRDISNVKYLTVAKNFFDLLPKTLHNSYEKDTLVFAPSVTTIYYMGTSREWRSVDKPESFFTNYFPKLREVICYSDGVTLTRRGKTTMMS